MENKNRIVREYLESMAEPKTKPRVVPKTKPGTSPGRPSPIRRDRPSVTPAPKATLKEVANKFLNLTKDDKEIKKLLKNKYSK